MWVLLAEKSSSSHYFKGLSISGLSTQLEYNFSKKHMHTFDWPGVNCSKNHYYLLGKFCTTRLNKSSSDFVPQNRNLYDFK